VKKRRCAGGGFLKGIYTRLSSWGGAIEKEIDGVKKM